MKKLIISILVSVLLSIILTTFIDYTPNENTITTIYTISGIAFSIGMGVVCAFPVNNILNKQFFNKTIINIQSVRNSFCHWFILSTFMYIVSKNVQFDIFSINSKSISINVMNLTLIFIIISVVFFVINFFSIQKLNIDIQRKIILEQNNR